MTGWLDRLLPRPLPSTRRRPDEMVYTVEDRPPLGILLGMGLQHALLGLVFALYAVIAAQDVGFDAVQTAAYVSATVFVMGCGTLLQSLPTRFGAGMLLVAIPSAGRLPIQVALTLQYGLGAVMGAMIVAGLLSVLLARVIPRLRAVFPPEVLGVVLVMMGLSLIAGGVSRGIGLSQGEALSPPAMLAAGVTVACMVAISIWGSAAMRRAAMMVGILAGTAVTATIGTLPGGNPFDMPWIAVPVLGLHLPMPELHPVPILVICLTQFITIMDQFGGALSMDRMTDADWRRADMPMVARSITGLGITQMLLGLAGALPGGVSSANIGLAHATGIAARRVGTAAGLALMLAAFFPPLAGLLALTPGPVVGGILLYTAAYLITAGMDLVMSRMMNPRRSFTVGLAVVVGTAVMLVPQLADAAPDWLRGLVHSGLAMGALAAVLLNALFRIGIRQTMRRRLDLVCEARDAVEALEVFGRLWGVRRDTILRAGHAVGEALEALRRGPAGGPTAGPVDLAVSFDEFTLVCTLSYRGQALRIGQGTVPDMAAAIEAEDGDIDAAMAQISALLIVRLADRVQSVRKGEMAEVTLAFAH